MKELKQLLGALVLLMVVGLGGFLYRNSIEMQARAPRISVSGACTQEAMVCPDGTAVGRTGPSCSFAVCKAPNVSLADHKLAFVLPVSYKENLSAATDTIIGAYEKESTTTPKDALVIRDYAIPAGSTAQEVLLAETTYETSGNKPKSISEFKKVTIGGNTFEVVTVERFEAVVHTLYYLARTNDVLRFEALDHGVTNWSDAKLDVATLPTHKAMLQLLGTLQLQ
jgi:hypothetical protein